MKRKCAGCGKPFEAKRSTAKYCSEACGRRARRTRATGRKTKAAPRISSVKAAVLKELTAADRHESVLGMAALELAEALASPFSTGSMKASLSKELRAVMAEALKGADKKADRVDELRKRRDEKERRAG